ncbi:ABC transporter substrate-binding protein [Microbacterium capsulatum]|uniref:ABC transporter substrate-binding protein n=1 Tax=Microbacterium capsulatum TaxID=3041921 RepID=A0ABU0XEI2_9MICO|nr:ABC transporter substrate-binding protein [Microbacterium sp. ASV81]MDQ4213124.1 ABC transporter substrate-binding protein [Microbacterium sp. ASV81]
MVLRKTALGAAALVTVAALALAGCSGSTKGQTSGPSALSLDLNKLATTTTAGTAPVDLVKWNLPYEPSSIDPIFTWNYAENTVDANLCESLVKMKPDLSTEQGLATKVDQPNDTTVVYTIRDGVKFWDGKPLTADDVAYSLQRQIGADTKSYWSDYFKNVASAEVTGPLQVTVKLSQPDVLFTQAMGSAAGAIVEKAAAVAGGQAFGTPKGDLQCTGPYKLDKWDSGKSLTISRNDAYWDSKVKPMVKQISFSFIADESTAVNALRTGDVDGQFFYLPPAGLSQLQKSSSVTTTFGKSFVFWTLAAINKGGALGDEKIRQALSLAIDRTALTKVVFQGAAIPAPTLANPAMWGYGKDVFAKAYKNYGVSADLAKAKKLVEEAGSPKTPIVLAVQGSSAVHEQTASVIQAAGQAIGLNVQTKVIPVEQFGNLYFDKTARVGLDGFFTTNYSDFADPLNVYSFFQTGNSHDYIDWNGADSEIAKALQTTDEAKRAPIVTDIEQKVTKGLPWIPLAYEPTTLIQNKRISGAVPSFAYLYAPWAVTIGGTK